jgi:hypothetical protein
MNGHGGARDGAGKTFRNGHRTCGDLSLRQHAASGLGRARQTARLKQPRRVDASHDLATDQLTAARSLLPALGVRVSFAVDPYLIRRRDSASIPHSGKPDFTYVDSLRG